MAMVGIVDLVVLMCQVVGIKLWSGSCTSSILGVGAGSIAVGPTYPADPTRQD